MLLNTPGPRANANRVRRRRRGGTEIAAAYRRTLRQQHRWYAPITQPRIAYVAIAPGSAGEQIRRLLARWPQRGLTT
jgi:hypothetical protein